MIDLYPAIDLRGGQVVRLHLGDYASETVYGHDPAAVAAGFAEAGARWIHVVDLDAARTGEATNRAAIGAIAAAVEGRARVQSGGGVRSEDAAQALADVGVSRVIIGTAAMEDPALVARIAARQPAAVGLDGRSGEVAVRGWLKGAGASVLDVLPRFADIGLDVVIITEITRDGTLAGPDLDGLLAALERTSLPIIASGGVGTLADVAALAEMSCGTRRLGGVITGKALYEGRFTVEEAIEVLR
jgi:phosphoribosylformimino-5-aminoimidazole carboxamide ribotide isomerase